MTSWTRRRYDIIHIHLPPRLYSSLQDFVHSGHRKTFDLITEQLGISPGETVVEVGCGTGILARHFVADGYDYWGIDVDPERIAAAQEQIPEAHFLVGDALAVERAGLPDFRYVFIHGLLHHLDDSQCRHLIDHTLSLGPDVVLVVIEPFRPTRWWTKPLSALFASMDEGQFIRTLQGWRALLEPNMDQFTTRSLWPRWPVEFIVARLMATVSVLGPAE